MKMFKRKQLGVTLLELIVSLGIGVILLTAIGRVYVMATKENATRTLRGELDESARQIFSTMARDISLAGFVDNFDGGTATGKPNGNKILVQSGNIKKLFNREDDTVTAISLLTGQKYMLPLQGSDKHLTIIYQAKNSSDTTITSGEDYRSLAGAYESQDTSGWAMNCVNNTDSALIDASGAKNSDASLNIYLKQDFVFNDTNKTFSCGMSSWNSMKAEKTKDSDEFFSSTKNNRVTEASAPSLTTTGQMKALVGDATLKDRISSVSDLRFRYTVTTNEHPSNENEDYTVAESVSGYYTDKILNYKGVKESDLGWGGVTGVEVCIVLAAAPTYSKQKITDIATIQPAIPTCERQKEDETADVSGDVFKDDIPRPAGDNRYYERYVRTLSAHNALYLR